jgi:uncharacterized membrane protein YdfJ with MMPL/SSD domain
MKTRIIQDGPAPDRVCETPAATPTGTRNLAARIGCWSARHRKKAIFGWLAFVILAFAIGNAVGTKTLESAELGVGESGRADKAAFNALPKKAEESVLVQSKTLSARDPQFRSAVADVSARLRKTADVKHVVGPYSAAGASQVSADKHSVLVNFDLPGNTETTSKSVTPALAAVAAAQQANPDLRVEQVGDASIQKALVEKDNQDLGKAALTSLPITLVILIIAFGSLIAAGVPLLLAISSVLATMGLVAILSHVSPVSSVINEVILLIGLAVGVDYALFYLKREREERAAGKSPAAALDTAAGTSGRAVLISGLTVIIAMAGMYLGGSPIFTSFATGTIVVVAVCVVGSVTVLPAVLSKLGDRAAMGRVPLLGGLKRRIAEASPWARLVDRVLKRPLLWALLSGGFLLALAAPTLGLHTALPGTETYSRDVSVMRTYDRVQGAFPSESLPATVVIKADDVTAPSVVAGVAKLERAARNRPNLFDGPATIKRSSDKTVLTIAIPSAGNGTDAASNRTLDRLREAIVPATVGKVDGVQADVTGSAAGSKDFNTSLKSHIPYVFVFVLSAAFLLLLITFRSIVIPIKAILLNLLSVGAAYGVLVLIFQDGRGEKLLSFDSNGAITPWLPLFLFVILFGLSMDYHVFILTRVREAYDSGMSTQQAVKHAIKSTAGTVTSAAAVMVAVFSVFATTSSLELKQMGVGLAVAILLDATIIRGILLPTTMTLLGDRNWWLPKSLGWMPRISHGADAVPPVAPAPVPTPKRAPAPTPA